jgi:fibronectin type 3 domain-containing protein
MKNLLTSATCLLLLLAGCGREGPPLPPFIRIPEPVRDLAVHQSGSNVILTWTNPAKNIDGSGATDLAQVQIRSGDSIVARVNVTGAAQSQSHSLPADLRTSERLTFTVQVETTRGKVSQISNAASVTVVEVPGKVTGLRAIVDQRRVTLYWERPKEHPELADVYVVTRSEPVDEPHVTSETQYEDNRYEAGKRYAYQVTAMRRVQTETVPGLGAEPIDVVVEDKVAPQAPAGLDIASSDTGAFLTWTANPEMDLAGYRVFRAETADGDFTEITNRVNTTNAFFDPNYRAGLYYAVSALDEFGNESLKSAPFRAP